MKDDALYLHVYQWRETITLTGLQNKVTAVTCISDPLRQISWIQEACGSLGHDRITLRLPGSAPDDNASVIKLQFKTMQVVSSIIEDDHSSIQLPACLSTMHTKALQPRAAVNITGVVHGWVSTDDWFSWEFLCEHPGIFDVTVTMSTDYHGNWDFGHEVVISCDHQEIRGRIENDGTPTDHYQKRTFQAGAVHLDAAGHYSISIRATAINIKNLQGILMSMVKLMPAG